MQIANYFEEFQEKPKISHANFASTPDFAGSIDAKATDTLLKYLESIEARTISNLPKRKSVLVPDAQICSELFLYCEKHFPEIPAMIIYNEISEFFRFNPTEFFKSLIKPIQKRLYKNLKATVSLDLYQRRVRTEYIERNQTIQPTFNSYKSTI